MPAEIAPGERLEMARGFVDKHFVSRGLAAQIDIHRPHEGERNWHAHILLTTRRLEGERLSPRKARDLDPMIRRGKFGKPLKAANERSRDALVVYAHLQETQQRFDGRALDAFLAKYIRDPDEREQVRDRVLELHQQDYERLAGLNRVASGGRRLGVQDLALELSPGYAAAERRRRKL